jgi:DHA1 family tetracycline resistance protein-like MFS transporter
LYGLFVLPESLPAQRRAGFTWRSASPLRSMTLLRTRPKLLGLASVNFLGELAHASLPNIGVLYMMYRYGWDERAVGFTMAGVGVCVMLVQGALIGPVVTRFGERAALFAGLAFGIAGFAVLGLAATGNVFLIGIPLLALWGFATPAALGLMSHQVGPSEQGQLQGVNASIVGIANLLGPGLFAHTFAVSIGGSGWHSPGAAFLLAAVILALSVGLACWAIRRRQDGDSDSSNLPAR